MKNWEGKGKFVLTGKFTWKTCQKFCDGNSNEI